MLPKLASDGRPFIPSWFYTVAGLFVLILCSIEFRDAKPVIPVIGAVFFIMGLAIEIAVIRARVEKLEEENRALRQRPGA
jgi:hypothetical protein